MGTWGAGIWQDDVADDVVIMFEDLRHEGKTPIEAIEGILADPPYPWGDVDDDANQILALAALALRHGVLDTTLRDRAIAMIASGNPMGRWEGAAPEDVAARKHVLETFTMLLERGTATADDLAEVAEPEPVSDLFGRRWT